MPKLTPKSQQKPIDCSRLRVTYEEQYDCMTIAHLNQDGSVISQACLRPEDAIDYANSIIAVFDEAFGIT